MLWEVQWVPAHWLCTIVSKTLQMFCASILSFVYQNVYTVHNCTTCIISHLCMYCTGSKTSKRDDFTAGHLLSHPSCVHPLWCCVWSENCACVLVSCHIWLWLRYVYTGCGRASNTCILWEMLRISTHVFDISQLLRQLWSVLKCSLNSLELSRAISV